MSMSMNMRVDCRQRGFTIVEFLIAGTLGLILLAGVLQLFVGSRQSFRLQDALSSVNDGGRFVVQYLSDDIMRAGWKDIEGGHETGLKAELANPVPFNADPTDCSKTNENVSASCEGGSDTAIGKIASHSDRLQVVYQGTTDCLGGEVNGGKVGIVINTYMVRNFLAQDDGTILGDFSCRGSDGTIQPLLSNVESFQVQYGMDSAKDPDDAADSFVDAAGITVADLNVGTRVVAIRFSIVIASEPGSLGAARDTSTVGNEVVVGGENNIVRNDRRLRRVFTRTVTIPNSPWFI